MQPKTRAYLQISNKFYDEAASHYQQLALIIESVMESRKSVKIAYESAPVMKSPLAYQAMYDHSRKTIFLNKYFIDSAPEPSVVETFLVFHELFHARENLSHKISKAQHLASEQCADRVAILALNESLLTGENEKSKQTPNIGELFYDNRI